MTNIGPFRADQVGSFLRPAELKQAREKFNEGTFTKEKLRKIEDKQISKLVEVQKAVGFEVITDGEFRRKWWHVDFIQALEGIRTYDVETPGFFQGELKTLTFYTVESKLGFPKNHPFLADFKFLKEAVGDNHVAKQTIPGPNMIFHSGVVTSKPYLENPTYESIDAVADDIVKVYQDAIQAFYDAGCRYLQLDDTSWGALFSEDFRKKIVDAGFDPIELTKKFADITVRAVENKPKDMAVTIHICRGNFKSSWLYQGGYDPIAEELFTRVNVDGFFLEFDDERSGDFSPLKYIKNQKVVLGLITSKTGELEDPEKIKARIQEAAQYVPLDQLCLSPQCGFASTEEGNLIDHQDQFNKLKLVKEIADDVWG